MNICTSLPCKQHLIIMQSAPFYRIIGTLLQSHSTQVWIELYNNKL